MSDPVSPPMPHGAAMPGDHPLDYETLMAEAAAQQDEMYRAMGRRPEGQEYRAEVDAAMLASIDPEASKWDRALGYLGLDALDPDDPAMPAPLRALLTLEDDEDSSPALALVGMGTAGVVSVGLVTLVVWRQGPEALLCLLPGVLATLLGYWAGGAVDAALRALHVLPPRPTIADRRDAALAALRAHPFVTTLSGKLVENVPTLSWLKSREQELAAAEDRCDEQIREIDAILKRTGELEAKLGQHDAVAQRTALEGRKIAVRTLSDRVKTLRSELSERLGTQEAQLTKVRSQAELSTLRDRSAALLGQQPTDDAARIAADLELDVGDLAKRFDAVKAELADQEDRWKAAAEVAGLAT